MPFGCVEQWLTQRRSGPSTPTRFQERLGGDRSAHGSVLPFQPPDPAILRGDLFLERAAAHGYLASKLAFLDHQFGHNCFPPFRTSVRVQTAVWQGRAASTCRNVY